jgi:hypothetical protein
VGILQCVAIVALTVTAGEAASRLLLGIDPLTDASLLWIHHPRWGWHHQPGSEDLFVKPAFKQRIRINSQGLREREIPYEKPAGTFRVLVIGDSAVAGFEVPPEAVFTRIAEDRLRERGYAVEIVNAGVRGYGTDQSLLFLQDEGLRYQPDLVLYKWTGNDPRDNATVHRPFRKYGKPWFDLDGDDNPVLRGVPVPDYPYAANLLVDDDGAVRDHPVDLRSRVSLWLRDVALCRSAFATGLLQLALTAPDVAQRATALGAYQAGEDVPARLDPDTRLFRLAVALVREMRRRTESTGAAFHMLVGDRDAWGRAVRDAASLARDDVHERYRARTPEGAVLLVPHDPHWNELGHRLYGEALAEWLEAEFLSPAPRGEAAPAAAPGA